MSLSLREELRVVLAPEQVLLVRVGTALTRRGLTHNLLDKTAVPCVGDGEGGEQSWSGAIKALEMALKGMGGRNISATVILSNHFMRYAMIPWSGVLKDEAEEAAVAGHFFSQLYGSAAGSWQFRLSPGSAGEPQLASAVERALIEALRRVFADARIKLRSIQPSLMAAYNSCRATLQKRSAWFVLFEKGSLCLALLQGGAWASVRTLRAGDEWRNTLPMLLEREAYLIDKDPQTEEVLLWAPELEKSALPESRTWKIHALLPTLRLGLTPDYDRRFAVALGG